MDSESKKEIVITGVRGFVGSNLCRYLDRKGDVNVTGASRQTTHLEGSALPLQNVCSYDDLYSAKETFDAYVHLAGKVIHDFHTADEQEYFEVNLEQTKRIYDRFLEDEQATTFIFLSTIHVLTEKPDRVIDESYEPQPFTPYGISKFEAENYLLNNPPSDGKKCYILRPSMIHGPGNKGNLNLLYELVKKGIPYPLGSVNNRRSFVSIENLCFIIHELLWNTIPQGLYHISDDEPTCTHDLLKMIADVTGKPLRMITLPMWLIRWVAKAGDLFPIPLNEHRLLKLTEDFIVSNKKIKEAIGKPLPVRAEEGLKITLESLKSLEVEASTTKNRQTRNLKRQPFQ